MAGIKPQSLRAVATSLSLPRDLERELTRRASQERVARSTVAVRLLRQALEAEKVRSATGARRGIINGG